MLEVPVGPGAGRPRRRPARPSARRPGRRSTRRRTRKVEIAGAGHHRAPAGEGAAADRHQGHRLDDPDRPRPARADHRRPRHRQDRHRDRHDHQPEGHGRHLRLRRHRPEGVDRRVGRGAAQAGRRDGVHDRRRRRRRPTRRRCSTSRPTPAARWPSTSCTTRGKPTLCVYDDLSKQAAAYRQLSLVLRRPPGREAYPGRRVLSPLAACSSAPPSSRRSGVVDDKTIFKPGGSLTALPIIETQAGDVSAYIPTNVISITDGQIFLEPDLFFAGVRPAINVGISVSRVGGNGADQGDEAGRRPPAPRPGAVPRARSVRRSSAPTSTRRRSRSSTAARASVEVLKQPQYQPMPVEQQVMIIFAVTNGFLDDVAGRARSASGSRASTSSWTPQFPQVGDGDPHRRRRSTERR